MWACIGAVLALAFGLLLGGAEAGEELMAMRGGTPDARTSVVMAKAPSEAVRTAVATDAGKPAVAVPGYVGWRNTCVRAPLRVAGRALQVETDGGYGMAQPFVELPGHRDGFVEQLFRELSQE